MNEPGYARLLEQHPRRLVVDAIHAIEAFLSDRMLPLVVQRADGGAVVRPPSD